MTSGRGTGALDSFLSPGFPMASSMLNMPVAGLEWSPWLEAPHRIIRHTHETPKLGFPSIAALTCGQVAHRAMGCAMGMRRFSGLCQSLA
ncbi:hypothetical protein SBA1_550099 [Candidatus Sulfotelmatobacter kueseliae]|uniref:Uncharacterized protein n=1 Tax=Candidatus Sulfotelmatobacter kueseliae TaxID=2042962 RepID=A0A2U3KYH0_9BACT|nr:hypothetical protein SBA1_550099 [Candidatus Sulfotelmatobacter kueseliae]